MGRGWSWPRPHVDAARAYAEIGRLIGAETDVAATLALSAEANRAPDRFIVALAAKVRQLLHAARASLLE